MTYGFKFTIVFKQINSLEKGSISIYIYAKINLMNLLQEHMQLKPKVSWSKVQIYRWMLYG